MGRDSRRGPWSKEEQEKIEHLKDELCGLIREVAIRNGWTQRQLAYFLHVSESSVSRVVRGRLELLTLNQLFLYLARIRPGFRMLISI